MEKAILKVAKELNALRIELRKIREVMERPAMTTVTPCNADAALFEKKEEE